ncbi:MAG: hypothetical protein WB297_02755 [Actinomycetota bacterium]
MSVDELDQPYDALLRRRDRKRRNQRIAAGVVGMAVFVAAIWIVTSVASLDRSEKSVVPGGTGPVQTGPAETVRIETGPAPSVNRDDPFWVGDGFVGLPPEGTVLSEPVRGELVASDADYRWHVSVYADGRLIWQHDESLWLERRLTPGGVDLLRSQPELLSRSHPELESLPASAWEDAQAKQYASSRYGVCMSRETIHQELPQQAQELLSDYTSEQAIERGEVEFFAGDNGSTCPAVTVDEARELDAVFREIGYRRTSESGESVWYEINGLDPSIVFTMLLPDGSLAQSGGR